MNNIDQDENNPGWDNKKLKESGVDFWTRVLLFVVPMRGMKRLSRGMGIDTRVADKAHALFDGAQTIDIVPSRSNSRGFQLIIDRHTALYFYQDGDHFAYDGFEMGEYDKGQVTIFDSLQK